MRQARRDIQEASQVINKKQTRKDTGFGDDVLKLYSHVQGVRINCTGEKLPLSVKL